MLVGVISYFVGCFNFAWAISRAKHKDIRSMGSGNPGTMNMSREFGAKIGVLTFFCDAFKGGIPCLIAYFVFRGKTFLGTDVQVSDFARMLSGVCVIIGHIFPITMRFKGGKGIASTFGLFWINLAIENLWFLSLGIVAFFLIALYIYCTEWGSMGSLIGVAGFSLWQGLLFYFRYDVCLKNPFVICIFAFILAIDLLTWCAHHQNVLRLLSGEEHHTSVKKMLHKK